jgi:hypothetical protein
MKPDRHSLKDSLSAIQRLLGDWSFHKSIRLLLAFFVIAGVVLSNVGATLTTGHSGAAYADDCVSTEPTDVVFLLDNSGSISSD